MLSCMFQYTRLGQRLILGAYITNDFLAINLIRHPDGGNIEYARMLE